jgi:hypothetical protein
MPDAQAGSLLFAAAVLAVLHAIPDARAASELNPCGQASVIHDLMRNFNANPAAKAQHLAMVDVVHMTTVAHVDGRLVCHGIVYDSEGAKTPMTITISRDAAGRPSWSLRLDDGVHPASLLS